MLKRIERTPEQNRKLIKLQIFLDVLVMILIVCALIWAVPRVNELRDVNYNYCYLCMKGDTNISCMDNGQMIYWEGEEIPQQSFKPIYDFKLNASLD